MVAANIAATLQLVQGAILSYDITAPGASQVLPYYQSIIGVQCPPVLQWVSGPSD